MPELVQYIICETRCGGVFFTDNAEQNHSTVFLAVWTSV